ncbi:MAG TPA: LysR family transcriptional regulator [Acidimicrobiales bacterium]
MLDIRRLEVLAAAVRDRSLTAAARSVGISPSAASQAIAALERQIGSQLLVRGPRGVEPTAVGERLSLHAEAVFAQLASAEAELSLNLARHLRVAAFATAMRGLLSPAIGKLRARDSAMTIEIVEMEPDIARAALRAGDLDMALVNHSAELSPDADGPWRVSHLLDEPTYVAVHARHPLALKRRVELGHFENEQWIMQVPASPCQQLTVRACAAAGFAPVVSAICADYASIIALIKVGHGVSLIPRLATQSIDLSGIALVRTRTEITRRINVLAAGDERVGAYALLASLREVVGQESSR